MSRSRYDSRVWLALPTSEYADVLMPARPRGEIAPLAVMLLLLLCWRITACWCVLECPVGGESKVASIVGMEIYGRPDWRLASQRVMMGLYDRIIATSLHPRPPVGTFSHFSCQLPCSAFFHVHNSWRTSNVMLIILQAASNTRTV